MAGWCGGREKSTEKREVPYPGEWQLPTSGRSSGETFPVVVAAEAAVVPGVFVPLVSWPWPAGGLGASCCAPASPFLLGGEAAGSEQRRCASRGKNRAPSGLQAPSPWQRPRPWGRAGGGETSRRGPPTVASRWPGPEGSAKAAVEAGAEGWDLGVGSGVQAAWRGAAGQLPFHQPVLEDIGRASGERARITSPLLAPPFSPGPAWSVLADVFE